MADLDIKRTTRGGGALVLFGLPFLGMGLLFVFLFLFPPAGMTSSGEPWVGALVGGVFAFVGACLVLGRSGTIMDRRSRTVTTWWGLLVPFSSTQYRLGQDAHVTMTSEVRRSKNSTYTVYPARLKGENLSVSFGEPRDYDASRRLAEDVAKFLHLAIHDTTGSGEVIREAGTLDESVQDRARRLGIATPLPAPPLRAVCAIQYGGPRSTTVVDIPPAGVGGAPTAGLVGALVFSAFVFFMFLRPMLAGSQGSEAWVFAALVGTIFIGFPIGAALLAMLKAATSQQRVTASPDGVQIRTQGVFGTKTVDLPAREIEEVESTGLKSDRPEALADQFLRNAGNLTPKQQEQMRRMAPKMVGAAKMMGQYSVDAGSVVLRSDRLSIELGSALARAEKEWLRNVIVHVLTSDVTAASAQPAAPAARPAPAPQAMPAATPATDYDVQPGKVQRKSGGGWAVSLIGLAALVFVLYQNGVLTSLLPKGIDDDIAPPDTESRPAAQAARTPAARDSGFMETEKQLRLLLGRMEQETGPDSPAVAMVLYQMGLAYQANQRPREQEDAWLRALTILQETPKKLLVEIDGSIDQEMVARGLGDFYWDQRRYDDAYVHYDMAYQLADDVNVDEAERNRRLASSSAGIMATACTLGKWEIADFAMAELKERIKSVSPEEQKRLVYWVRTGEPRLKKRKC